MTSAVATPSAVTTVTTTTTIATIASTSTVRGEDKWFTFVKDVVFDVLTGV